MNQVGSLVERTTCLLVLGCLLLGLLPSATEASVYSDCTKPSIIPADCYTVLTGSTGEGTLISVVTVEGTPHSSQTLVDVVCDACDSTAPLEQDYSYMLTTGHKFPITAGAEYTFGLPIATGWKPAVGGGY